MRRDVRLVTALLGLALAAAPPPAAAEERLALERAPFSADAYGDVIAWSSYDPAMNRYGLRVLNGGAPVATAAAPSPEPFDLDVGPGPDGAPLVVYSRAGDLFRLDPSTGAETPIAEVNTARAERMPSVHRQGLAFARGARVYLRRDGATRRQRRPRFGDVIEVESVELGSRGLFVVYRTDLVPTCCTKATLYRIAGGRLRHVFSVTSGGANLGLIVSPSLVGRSVFFGRTNTGSGQGNRFFRYDLRSRRLLSARGTRLAHSLTWRGDRFLMSREGPGCFDPRDEPTAAPSCELVLTDRVRFAPAARSDVRRTRP